MEIKIITGPTTEPISTTTAKLHLRVDITEDNDYIDSLVTVARQYCEGFQARKYITQTLELTLDRFPSGAIELPYPPLISVTSVKYTNSAGTETTMTETDEYLVDSDSNVGHVYRPYNVLWPTFTPAPRNAVRVRYVAGYGGASDVPTIIKQAMLLIVGHLYENREDSTEKSLANIPMGAKALLSMDRVVTL